MNIGPRRACRVKVKKNRGLQSLVARLAGAPAQRSLCPRRQGEGYRSRAAFKLLELDAEIPFSEKRRPGAGSGRGARRLEPGGGGKAARTVVAADVLAMEAIPGVTFFQADLTDAATSRRC